MKKKTFKHFCEEVKKEVPDRFSDEALKIIFDSLEDEFEVQDIWQTFIEVPFDEFIFDHEYLKPTQEAVEQFITAHSRFLGFTSDKSVVFEDF